MEFYFNESRSGESTTEVSDTFSLSSTSKHMVDYGGSLPKHKYDSLSKYGLAGRASPGHDLGYHTLLTRDGITPTPTHTPKVSRRLYEDRSCSSTPFHWNHVPSAYHRSSECGTPPVPHPLTVARTPCPLTCPSSRASSVLSSRCSNLNGSSGVIETNSLNRVFKGKRPHRTSYFDRLPDDIILKIFSYLSSNHLCVCARVCRRWYFLAWEPQLWSTICLGSDKINMDKGLKTLFRLLCRDSPTVCLTVDRISLNGCCKLTDKGLITIARRCPELRTLEIRGCCLVTNCGIGEIMARCTSIQKLDLTGCHLVTTVQSRYKTEPYINCASGNMQIPPPPPHPPPPPPPPPLSPTGLLPLHHQPHPHHHHHHQFILQMLDMTDCHGLEDTGLKIIVKCSPQLTHLYLRRCIQITDSGIKAVASYCIALRELSISDCVLVTDFGMYELAKLRANLRYLSVAKCDQISDAGIKQIARHCYKLRYLNVRGCEAVSDQSIEVLARNCPRLRAVDIGKCDVTDNGLRLLSEHCPNLKKLSVKSCDLISDRGIQSISFYCRGLQQLNIQDCNITIEGYRTVKKYCKRCIIEHTNPGFH